jgi:DNA-binding PucR family transcriptional regulator
MIQPLQTRNASPAPGPRRALRTARSGSSAPTDHAAEPAPARAEIPAEALDVLQGIAERAGGCAEAMALHLHQRLPELDQRSVAGSAFDETRACCQAHLEVVARVVSKGGSTAAIAIPDPAIEHARSLIRRGVALDVLLRTYHLGQAFLCARAAALFQERVHDDALRLQATLAVDAFLFEYIDRVSEAMAAIYGDERNSWHRSPEAVRAEALQAIMERRGVDERRLERRLGYDLTGHHMAFILATDHANGDFGSLRTEAQRIAAALAADALLVVPGEGATAWAWCRTIDDASDAAARLQATWHPAKPMRIAFAGPAPGLDGFRESHLEALDTLEFAGRFPGVVSPRGTIAHRTIELLLLLTDDSDRAARFMRSRLGRLVGEDPRLRDLRVTALGFLQHNRSHARTGEALFLHKNTIFTRIKRAEKLLELRSDDWGIELEAALLLASILEVEPRD